MNRSAYRKVLNALIFASAITAIVLDYLGSSLYDTFKPWPTVLVILLPILEKGENKVFTRTLIWAFCFCLLGDILLLDNDHFVYGLAAFFIAHLLFARGFMGLEGFQGSTLVALVLLTMGIGLYAWLYPDLGTLKFPVATYVLVILFMAWQGIGLYLIGKTRVYGLIALGAMFFMLSDSILAVNKFKHPFGLSGLLILATYWLAISLIANAACLVPKKP